MRNRTFYSGLTARCAMLAAACLLALSGAAGGAADPKASRFYEDALQRYQKRDLEGALIQLKNALQVDRNLLQAQLLMGKVLFENEDLQAAEVALEEALKLGVNRAEVVVPLARTMLALARPQTVLTDSRFAEAGLPLDTRYQLLLIKASAAGDNGDPKQAIDYLESARGLLPGDARAWLAEVPLRIRGGQFREATTAAERALALQPDSAEAQYLRGTVSHVQGELAAAMRYYNKALSLEPAHIEGLVSRSGVALDLDRLPDAKRDIAAILVIGPKDPRGAYLKALVAEREGRKADARAALADVVALLDRAPIEMLRFKPQLLMLGGLAHFGLDQTDKAKPYLEGFLRQQPGSPAAKLMARIHIKDGNAERAIEVLDNYLRRHPGDAQATLLLASAHMSQGRHARATLLLQGALQREDRADFRNALGLAMMKRGKFEDALPELEAAYKKDPKRIQAGTALAALYLHTGRQAAALSVAEQLNRQFPNQPGLLHLLGSSRASTGDVKGARAALEAAAKLDPAFVDPQVELARLDAAAGAVDAALVRLTTLSVKNDRHIGTLTLLGQLEASRGRLEAAQRWLEKADDHSAADALETGIRLVDFHLTQRQIDRAQEAMKRLTQKAPEALEVLIMQSRVDLAAGNPRGARVTLSRASSLAAYDAPALVRLAELQLAAADPSAASHSLDKALKERPDYFRAAVLKVTVDIARGELGSAEQRARQIVARRPKLGVGYVLLGDIELARQNRKAALDAYRRAHQLDQTEHSLMRLFLLLARDDHSAAIRMAEQWLVSHPRDLGVRRALSDAHASAGNWAAARNGYEELLKRNPGDAEALNNLANVLVVMKDPAALQAAERALALKPGSAHIISTAGWAAHHAGQPDRALSLLRDARLRDPSSSETRFYLGAVLAAAGRHAEAKTELQAALAARKPFRGSPEAELLLRTLK